MPNQTRIVYYVTSHGYGHMNRAASVIDSLPRSVHVVVKTAHDLIERFQQSINRVAEFAEGVFDSGAVHPAGESSLMDGAASLSRYQEIHEAGRSRLDAEVAYLRAGQFSAVVSDIAPLPLRAARLARIPGVLVANFTWCDIFAPYVRDGLTEYREMLEEMRREYDEATVVLRAQPALEIRSAAPVRDVGLIARRGRRRRRELRKELGVRDRVPLVYMYVGRYGQDDMEWQNLHRLTDFDFVSYHSVPGQSAHWHVVDPGAWSPADLAASVDVMVAKAGYGTVTDAMVSRTPLIFPPRFGFVEHRVLAAALRRWGGGLPISTRDFKSLGLRGAIERIARRRAPVAPWSSHGAAQCARQIVRVMRNNARY
jgi:hypothetical protein